jgi:hypothetical protein
MHSINISDTLQELNFLVEQSDISRASRKILDLTKEFDLPPNIELLAHEIRAQHNLAK